MLTLKRICCSLILKTYLLALLISIATVYTPALVLGIPTFDNNSTSVVKRWTWIRLFAELS
jgi:phosphatidylinositol glycan class F